jgi:hypothetical protein
MLEDKNVFDFVLDTFYAQGVEKQSYINNKRLPNFMTCRFNISVFDEYLRCTGYRTWDYTEYINRFIESFSGNWYLKVYEDEDNKHKNKKFLG